MKLGTLLNSIGSTEESSFREICQDLGDSCPDSKEEWRDFFGLMRAAETEGLIEISRMGDKIDSAILTDAGVARIKEIRR